MLPHCPDCSVLGRETYHRAEAERIAQELATLDPTLFHFSGIVRYVLTSRMEQEQRRANGEE